MPDNEYTNELQTIEPQEAAENAAPMISVQDPAAPQTAPAPAPDTSIPRAMLTEALQVVDTLDADRAQLQQYNDAKKQLDKELETLTRNIEKEKNDTVKSRRLDVETGFDKQIKAVDSEIGAINSRRQKAREEMVKSRVADNTAGLRQEIANMKTHIREYIKEQKLPSILGSRLYYTLFSPINFTDWLVDILLGAICVYAIVFAYMKQVSLPAFLIVLAVIVLLVVIYVTISAKTKGAHPEAVSYIKGILKGIAERSKTIKAIEKNIRSDKDDSVYDLSEYDNEIRQKSRQKDEINVQKTEALSQFDNVTRGVILNEIDSKYTADVSTLQAQIAQNTDSITVFGQKVAAGEKRLNNEFVQYVGTRNLSHGRIEQMIGLIDSGEAVSVSDAISKLK